MTSPAPDRPCFPRTAQAVCGLLLGCGALLMATSTASELRTGSQRALPKPPVEAVRSADAASANRSLAILPADIRLSGPQASGRLLVLEQQEDAFFAAPNATLQVADPTIARIENGIVHPLASGETAITATSADGRTATARLEVAGVESQATWSFRNHVQSVLTKTGCNSGACHGALAGQNGFRLSLRAYDPAFDHASLTRQAAGRRINPADPARSLLLTKPTGAVAHKGGVRLEPGSQSYQVLAEWIAAGAPGPADEDPRIEQLEILPPALVSRPGQSQQFLVRAHFSDGHVEDVTHWAKFTATDQTVAKVEESGLVTVIGQGEGAITAWYLGQNSVATVRAPYETSLPPETFADAKTANFIDAAVLDKLASLNIPPSPIAADEVFLRRAYLDTIGLPPTPDEIKAFLADKDPQKRIKLVDRLLARPEFVDYWAYRWSDLLLVNSDKLNPTAADAYYGWIREQVQNNTPWDEFARGIVTATGSSGKDGAVNFFALHQDPQDMAESVSMTFLGMAINCARCHDHPLEKWTNDQYYGMANLFARVRSKGPDTNRIVFETDRGDLIQPRTGKPQPPCPLDGEPLEFDSTIDRREHLAAWLTAKENPYFARAIINRVWANFFGVGIIEAVDDVRLTNPPSNAELLTALETDFVENGYDLKRLMRLILTSQTYQRSSETVPGNEADTKYFSHPVARRIKAEVLLDALSQATLTPTQFDKQPLGTRALQLHDVKVASYFLDTFGRPDREQTCECERSDMPSVKQVLHLMNGDTLNEKLSHKPDKKTGGMQNRIGRALAAKQSNEQIIDGAFLATICRLPTEEERSAMLEVLSQVPPEERRLALEDLYWGLLTSKEFLFQH